VKYTWRIGKIPDGNTALANQNVVVRKVSDGTTITSLTTDSNGFITLERDGHLEPFYLHLQDVPGGDKFWRSDESHTVSVFSPKELPVALRLLGDGVIRGYGSELAVALAAGGPSFAIADGAAVVAGHPVVQYAASTAFSVSRPVTSTRIDRIIIRLYPEGSATTPGKADIAVLTGVEGAAATALTQTSTVHEVGLYTLTVPTAGAVTLTDERVFANELTPVSAITRSDAQATTSGSGEALTALTTSLVLPHTSDYLVESWVSAIQDNAIGWVRQATYGSLGAGTDNLNTPHQVAVDPSGNVYIADFVNSRLVKRNSSGAYLSAITSLPSILGVCVDTSGGIYVTYLSSGKTAVAKYNSSFVLQWAKVGASTVQPRHCATDNTYVYVTFSSNVVNKIRASDGLTIASWGGTGSADGQFQLADGIATDGTYVYVSDFTLNRIQKFTTAGVFVAKWGSTGTGGGEFTNPYPIAIDGSGNVWVGDFGNDRMQRFSNAGAFQTSIAQDNPSGIGIASGDILWISNNTGHNIAKWDEAGVGYGGLAIEIDGNLSSYITLGDLTAMLQNSYTHTATGPATISVKVYGKSTSGTATFRSVVLSARAVPRA
jgi:hypothetical protein